MDVYQKSARLARDFSQSYPTDLAERLEWWGRTLSIDREKMLRLLGMSARQAEGSKSKDLKGIVSDSQWEANAWGLEGLLVEMISLFSYDPRSLREYLGESNAAHHQAEPLDVLVGRLHKGGADWLPNLYASLVAARNGTTNADEGP